MSSATRFASRKFVLASAAFVTGVTFFAFRQLDATQWIGYTEWVLGLYMAGNIGDTYVTPK